MAIRRMVFKLAAHPCHASTGNVSARASGRTDMPAPLVQVRNVVKDFRALRPLRLRHFDLGERDSVALLGFDQAMAEVLVSLITGAIVPDEGFIAVFGQETTTIA